MHTVQDPLARGTLIARDEVAAICGESTLSYWQLNDRVHRLAFALSELGLGAGDRVGIVAGNCHRYVESYLAIPAAGMVIVPINTRASEPEMEFVLRDAGVKVLITDRAPARYEAGLVSVIRMPEEYEDVVAAARPEPLHIRPSEEDLAGIFYTGGTTGRSKGVMLTHRNLISNAITALVWAKLRKEDRWLVMAPMHHAAGTCLVLSSLWIGASQVMLPAFSAAGALDLIERHQASGTLAVPTMMIAMNDEQTARPRNIDSLRLLSHGASPAPVEVLRRAHAVFPKAELLHLYGTTETAPIATTFQNEEQHLNDELAGSVGQPALGVEVAVFDPDNTPAPSSAAGEIVLRGNNVMAGYWGLPEESAKALEGGWYHTGDLGFITEAGYLFLNDRLKDMVVTGGENVYTIEVEDALYQHPKVQEAAVFGVPDERWGESVLAVVVPRETVTEEEIISHLRPLIAGYKIPRHIIIQNEPLPKSAAGKILKRQLREPYWQGRKTRIGN